VIRTLLVLIALAGCGSRAPAPQAPPPPREVAPQAEPARPERPIDEALIHSDATLARPFYHRATEGKRVVHILGTVHLGIAPARLPEVVWQAVERSPIFAMEVDLSDMSGMADMLRSDGTTLDQELGPDYWAKLEAAIGADAAAMLRGFKTSIAAMMVSIRGIPMTDSMDAELRKRAEAAGARLAFFETSAFQSALLDRWMDVRMLKAILDDLDGNQEVQLQMLTAYAQGDESAMTDSAAEEAAWLEAGRSLDELHRMNQEMLDDRNAAWIPQIEALSADGELFVAVGAAHLYGPAGVLQLLADQGWTVERVSP
jgi:hypothetical protein